MIPEEDSGEGGAATTRPCGSQAADALLPQVYDELRRLAAHKLAQEAAEVLGISEPTAKRHWAYARAWLLCELDRERHPHGSR